MDTVNLLGLAAGALTTMSFIPQVLKTWRSRSAKDISLGMFLTLFAGISLWVVYGFYINSLPVIIANIVTLIFASVIILLKFKYR